MSFRVYDIKNKYWIVNDICLTPDEELYMLEKSTFGKRNKLIQVPKDEYIIHRDIGLTDKNGILIYEGDIVEAAINEDETINAEVAYAEQVASYVILDFKTNRWYGLGIEECNHCEVVGNVIDTPHLLMLEEEVGEDE